MLTKDAAIEGSNEGVRLRSLETVRLDGATGRPPLQRLFSTFLRGRAGIGLLLLRAALGVTAAYQGILRLPGPSDASNPSWGQWILCLTLIVSGAALVLGFLTPFAGLGAGISFLGMAVKWLPLTAIDLRDARLLALGGVVAAVSIVLLGPGAFSLDAYWFGRREIVIPPSLPPPEP